MTSKQGMGGDFMSDKTEKVLYEALVDLVITICPDYNISQAEDYFQRPLNGALSAIKMYETKRKLVK